MKIFEVIKKVFLSVCTVAFFVFAIGMTILLLNFNQYGVTELGGTSLVIIQEDTALETYKKGDLVLVQKRKLRNLKEGDEVFTYRLDSKNEASIEVGIIGKIYQNDEAISFENGDTYSIEYVIGTADKKYSTIGTLLSIFESKWGFLFTVLVPSFLFFVYQLYALIIEIKYGEEED